MSALITELLSVATLGVLAWGIWKCLKRVEKVFRILHVAAGELMNMNERQNVYLGLHTLERRVTALEKRETAREAVAQEAAAKATLAAHPYERSAEKRP